MERTQTNHWSRKTRYETMKEAKTLTQVLQQLRKNKLELKYVKSNNLK